jgi:biotin carboxyl carrier protein
MAGKKLLKVLDIAVSNCYLFDELYGDRSRRLLHRGFIIVKFTLEFNEKSYDVSAYSEDGEEFIIVAGGEQFSTKIAQREKERFEIAIGCKKYIVKLDRLQGNGDIEANVNGKSWRVQCDSLLDNALTPAPSSGSEAPLAAAGGKASQVRGAVVAPMPGTVVSICKQVGESVKAGETILTIEAMKMENEIKSPHDGNLKELRISVGNSVDTHQILAVVR